MLSEYFILQSTAKYILFLYTLNLTFNAPSCPTQVQVNKINIFLLLGNMDEINQ